MERPIQDERITKETNALVARFAAADADLAGDRAERQAPAGRRDDLPVGRHCVAVGAGLAAVLLTVKGVWRAQDEAMREIRDSCLCQAFGVMFAVLIVGEFVAVMVDGEHIGWYVPTVMTWFIPSVIFTVTAIRRGLFQWGGRKAEKSGQKRLAGSTAVSALLFGAVMGLDKCFVDGAFQPEGLLTVAGMALSWGVMYYLGMTLMLRIGGKQADKAVQDAEGAEDDEASHA